MNVMDYFISFQILHFLIMSYLCSRKILNFEFSLFFSLSENRKCIDKFTHKHDNQMKENETNNFLSQEDTVFHCISAYIHFSTPHIHIINIKLVSIVYMN